MDNTDKIFDNLFDGMYDAMVYGTKSNASNKKSNVVRINSVRTTKSQTRFSSPKKVIDLHEQSKDKAKKINALPPGEIEAPIRTDSADKVNSNQQSFVESITVDNKGGKIENEALSALSENRSQNSDQIKSVSQEHDEQ